MKTNMEYLREFIEGNDEAIEFWDAVSKEMEELEDENNNLKSEVNSLEEKVENLEDELDNAESESYNLEEIDCGIGLIRYEQPENLKLQCLMDEFKEKTEKAF